MSLRKSSGTERFGPDGNVSGGAKKKISLKVSFVGMIARSKQEEVK